MFANRFSVVIDACVLVRVLPRNIILSLAEAGLFRVRWTETILEEFERVLRDRLFADREDRVKVAAKQRERIETAFPEAMVDGHEACIQIPGDLPDENDRHVIAAAIKSGASGIVTDNLKDFPDDVLRPFDIEVKSADSFIADTIDLPEGHRAAIAAIRRMRQRLKRPEMSSEQLLLRMEQAGLLNSVIILKDHLDSL